jgi:hypothetical protein
MVYPQWFVGSGRKGFECAVAIAVAAFLLLSTAQAAALEKDQDPPLPHTLPAPLPPDTLLPKINSAIQGVTHPSVKPLAAALHVGGNLEDLPPEAPRNTLQVIGDIDGDGVPEVLLKWAVPDSLLGADIAPDPNSRPLWSVYLLSWDGAHWKASRLEAAVESFTPAMVHIGPSAGRGLALVIPDTEEQTSYPEVFQIKDHAASLIWDSQSDDSRYQPLIRAKVTFQDDSGGPSEMIVTGRADPGLLHFAREGKRGFEAHVVYHWDGKALVPAKTEYSANQDYTLYRFISALHLHDYSAAYSLIVPAKFLGSDSPSLDSFRKFVQDTWPELLQDNVFQAPEVPTGSSDKHLFVLSKPDQRFVYRPVFTNDGNFLLTGLARTREALPIETQ